MLFSSKLNSYLSFALKNQANLSKFSPDHADLKVKIGLEIHARILSQSKIFSKFCRKRQIK